MIENAQKRENAGERVRESPSTLHLKHVLVGQIAILVAVASFVLDLVAYFVSDLVASFVRDRAKIAPRS